jgi:hypothetical protein
MANSGFSQGSEISLYFKKNSSGKYEMSWSTLAVQLTGGDWFFTSDTVPLNLNIMEYGNLGEFIKGTLNGTCQKESTTGSGQEYPLKATFSVLREE